MSTKDGHKRRNHAAEGELVGGVAERICAVARHLFEGNWKVFRRIFRFGDYAGVIDREAAAAQEEEEEEEQQQLVVLRRRCKAFKFTVRNEPESDE